MSRIIGRGGARFLVSCVTTIAAVRTSSTRTVCSERAKHWMAKRPHPLRRNGDVLWVDCLAAAPMLNEAAESGLAIGWQN